MPKRNRKTARDRRREDGLKPRSNEIAKLDSNTFSAITSFLENKTDVVHLAVTSRDLNALVKTLPCFQLKYQQEELKALLGGMRTSIADATPDLSVLSVFCESQKKSEIIACILLYMIIVSPVLLPETVIGVLSGMFSGYKSHELAEMLHEMIGTNAVVGSVITSTMGAVIGSVTSGSIGYTYGCLATKGVRRLIVGKRVEEDPNVQVNQNIGVRDGGYAGCIGGITGGLVGSGHPLTTALLALGWLAKNKSYIKKTRKEIAEIQLKLNEKKF